VTKTLDQVARGYVPSFDGLRAIAILAVMGHNFQFEGHAASTIGAAISRVVDWGWVGVELFFVLSGFLITGILLDTRERRGYYSNFVARRVLRIFPIYYLTLFTAFAVIPLVTGRQIEGHEHQIWLWTYLSNWVGTLGLTVAAFPHFWSLAVEEQFYLIWPLVVKRLAPKTLVIASVVLGVIALASRVALRVWAGDAGGPYAFTVCRMDALVLGAAAAVLLRERAIASWVDRSGVRLGLGAAALFVIGGVVTRGYPRAGLMTQTLGYSLLAVVFTVLVVLAVRAEAHGSPLARALSWAPLRSVGKYSYAMYIFHSPLHLSVGAPLFEKLHSGPVSTSLNLLYFAVMAVVTYLAGLCSYHLIEKHFLALKRHFVSAA
jgi:peptidoglycan/LPS O-acetylase OafA/YrhL